MASTTEGRALSVRGATKSFGGSVVLDSVDVEVCQGSIHGLLGGNGSGKSTLIKLLAGVYQADRGSVTTVNGSEDLTSASSEVSRRLGLRFVHQNLGLFPSMTIAENMAVGSGFPRRGPQIAWRSLRDSTAEQLAAFGVQASPDTILGALRPAEQTLVAVARALSDRDSVPHAVLVLDEPTAALPRREVDVLFDALRASSAAGQTIVIVSHRIDEVLSLTNEVSVLRDGRLVTTAVTSEVGEDDLVGAIAGRRLEQDAAPGSPPRRGSVVAEVRGLSAGPVANVSFDVHAGEIVGIAGMLGAGRTEILRALFGDFRASAGSLAIDGNSVELRSPSHVMSQGVALIPEDRGRDAIFPSLTVFENTTVANLPRFSIATMVRTSALRRATRSLMTMFLVRASSEMQEIQFLSGGNQQKIVLARWLSRNPRLVLLDEPTQGVDIGARAEIYSLIRKAMSEGVAFVLASSDYDELARFSDRVLLLKDGEIVDELAGTDLTAHAITSKLQSGELTV